MALLTVPSAYQEPLSKSSATKKRVMELHDGVQIKMPFQGFMEEHMVNINKGMLLL
jgi:hypothetical protein